MKTLTFIINLFLSVGFVVCFLSLALLHLANSQLLVIIYLMFTCAFGLFLNNYLITTNNK